MRVVGMDIHRSFAQVAILEDGQITRELRVDLVRGPLVNFAKTLSLDDEVVIEATGKDALREMRRLLGVLRTVDESALMEPQPSLAELPDLLERAAATGLRPQLEITGEQVRLPAAIDLSAYRIIQEALTNALKHGGPCDVRVGVHYLPDGLSMEIRNTPRRNAPSVATERGGHGVVGMRERVAMCGGTLTAGPNSAGEFVVAARLPVG